MGVEVPGNVTYVAIDFETTSLADGLGAGGVAADQVTFFSWPGVLVYLDGAEVDAVLRTGARMAAMGEPWKTRLEPEELFDRLRRAGLTDIRPASWCRDRPTPRPAAARRRPGHDPDPVPVEGLCRVDLRGAAPPRSIGSLPPSRVRSQVSPTRPTPKRSCASRWVIVKPARS